MLSPFEKLEWFIVIWSSNPSPLTNIFVAHLCDPSYNFQNLLFLLFDIDYKEVRLQLQMEFIDLQYSEDLKFKFLV